MEKTQEQKAVLFVDIVDSTKLYDNRGDADAQSIVSDALSLLSDIVVQYFGHVIKTLGDSVMATFDSGDAAVEAALFMQKIFQTNQVSELAPAGAVALRTGFVFGEVVLDQNDVFGNAVNLAARIVAEAKSGQVLTNKETIDSLDEVLIKSSRFIVKKQLKGLQAECEIYEVMSVEDNPNVTTIAGNISQSIASSYELTLKYQEQTIIMGAQLPVIKIGRSAETDLTIVNANISRQHASIEFKSNKYILKDKSVNGTYVSLEDEPMQKVHMDQMTLYKSGKIYFGSPSDEVNAVFFDLKINN